MNSLSDQQMVYAFYDKYTETDIVHLQFQVYWLSLKEQLTHRLKWSIHLPPC